jgi:glycosyltransferase involved in cell wall biosynthesis
MARNIGFNKQTILKEVPNPVNPNIFKILNQTEVLSELGWDQAKKRILFVVAGDVSAYHKGIDLLIKALGEIEKLEKIELLVVGDSSAIPNEILKYPCRILGTITDQELMCKIYNSSDVVISTSRQDNLPNTLLEASACGVPIVAFNIGGIPEIVNNSESGSIIEKFDTVAFGESIMRWINRDFEIKSRNEIRARALTRYAPKVSAEAYSNLYTELIKRVQK